MQQNTSKLSMPRLAIAAHTWCTTFEGQLMLCNIKIELAWKHVLGTGTCIVCHQMLTLILIIVYVSKPTTMTNSCTQLCKLNSINFSCVSQNSVYSKLPKAISLSITFLSWILFCLS